MRQLMEPRVPLLDSISC